MISYEPLLITLVKRNMTKTKLREQAHFSTATLAKLSKNEYVSLEVIESICKALDCNIEDVIEIRKKKEEETR